MKKTILKTALCLSLIMPLANGVFAQEDSTKTKKEVLVRPDPSGIEAVDAFTAKSFDTYDESRNISKEIEFVKVEIKEVKDIGDGVTQEIKISNGKGEAVTKEGALVQFGTLLIRAMKQNENIKATQALQQAATDEVKSISPLKKAKAAKTMSKATNALTNSIAETKKQIDLINQQIATIKAIKKG
jgi:hypothetical protein